MTQVLIPSGISEYRQHLETVVSSTPLSPFCPLVIEAVDTLSKTVLLNPVMNRMPEMAAAAHWMRKSHVLALQKEFESQQGDRFFLPRGVALHFAPSNVDSIFVYSWFISMLLGNKNIIRLSRHRGKQVDLLLEAINSVLEQDRFRPILDRSLVLSYEYDDVLTRELSGICQVRVLWGGDESVRRLRAIPMNPLGTEVAFANRFSLATLNANLVVKASSDSIAQLATGFFNDAYWFDQMACSSPRLLVWIGKKDTCTFAQKKFWTAVSAEVERRSIQYAEVIGLNKLVAAYKTAANGGVDLIPPDVTGPVSRVHISSNAKAQFRSVDCGGGLFFETELDQLNDLVRIVTERDQTLSYFGFDREELSQLISILPARAVDRIVPIGTALDFSMVWDGSSLVNVFTREIYLR
jgi:hypothetical protein